MRLSRLAPLLASACILATPGLSEGLTDMTEVVAATNL